MRSLTLRIGLALGVILVVSILVDGCTKPPPQICAPPAGYGGGVLTIDDSQRDDMLARADSVVAAHNMIPATMERTVTDNDLTMEISYSSGGTVASHGIVVELCKPSGEVLTVRFLQ